jgi:hypothetical protein
MIIRFQTLAWCLLWVVACAMLWGNVVLVHAQEDILIELNLSHIQSIEDVWTHDTHLKLYNSSHPQLCDTSVMPDAQTSNKDSNRNVDKSSSDYVVNCLVKQYLPYSHGRPTELYAMLYSVSSGHIYASFDASYTADDHTHDDNSDSNQHGSYNGIQRALEAGSRHGRALVTSLTDNVRMHSPKYLATSAAAALAGGLYQFDVVSRVNSFVNWAPKLNQGRAHTHHPIVRDGPHRALWEDSHMLPASVGEQTDDFLAPTTSDKHDGPHIASRTAEKVAQNLNDRFSSDPLQALFGSLGKTSQDLTHKALSALRDCVSRPHRIRLPTEMHDVLSSSCTKVRTEGVHAAIFVLSHPIFNNWAARFSKLRERVHQSVVESKTKFLGEESPGFLNRTSIMTILNDALDG